MNLFNGQGGYVQVERIMRLRPKVKELLPKAGGQASQAMGRTKGGLNTKIHVLVNVRSQAVVIALSAGNDADISLVEEIPLRSSSTVN